MPESDTRLAQVVGRHLHVHAITDADTDEILPHLPGDVGEDFVAVGQGHAKHGAGEDLSHCPDQLDGFFFSQVVSNGLSNVRPGPFSPGFALRAKPCFIFTRGDIEPSACLNQACFDS